MTLYLAPMAGISDWPMRRLCFQQGADLCVTEMVSAQGYLEAPKERLAYDFLTRVHKDEGPVLVQVFGHRPEYLAEAAKQLAASGRFAGVDINMGCPAPKVTNGGSGSAMMKNLPLAAQCIRAVRAAVSCPLSVKMRLGWDDKTACLELAQIAEAEGANRIFVHGRTRVQQYAGQADMDMIARVKQAVRIPVIANGDVVSAETAKQALDITHADGLMIGRAALGNLFLFAEIKAGLAGLPYTPPTLKARVETAVSHARDMVAWKGEKHGVIEMRKHFAWYIKGVRGAARLRTRLNLAASVHEAEGLLYELINET